MNKRLLKLDYIVVLGIAALSLIFFAASLRSASAAYTFDVTNEQPWTDQATTVDTSQTVSVRSYVPGSNTITYRNMTVYSSNTTAGSNSLGDLVGYEYNIYGT